MVTGVCNAYTPMEQVSIIIYTIFDGNNILWVLLPMKNIIPQKSILRYSLDYHMVIRTMACHADPTGPLSILLDGPPSCQLRCASLHVFQNETDNRHMTNIKIDLQTSTNLSMKYQCLLELFYCKNIHG